MHNHTTKVSSTKIVRDLAGPSLHNFKRTIQLAPVPQKRLTSFARTALALVLIWGSVLGGAIIPSRAGAPMAEAQTYQDERTKLEAELKQLEAEMAAHQKQIDAYRAQGKTLGSEIGKLNSQIAKLNLQIKAVNLTLADLGVKINATTLKIQDLEGDIDRNEASLGSMLQNLYEEEQTSVFEVMMEHENLSDFVNDLTHISSIQSNLYSTITQIKSLRDDLTKKKQELVVAKADAETTRQFQVAQQNEVASTKNQKATILAVTKGQESKYQELLKETQKRAAEIRARLFNLQGGGAMQFGQAYDLAKMASASTGVRPAFLLAILSRESALGRNVGQCTYHTAMRPADRPLFVEIATAAGRDPETQKVSCPNADGPYGGAMGPAQFIPSTWKSYAPRITRITGRPADPWNNADAFIAAGLYLADAGATTNERAAAAKYYCGPANYTRNVCMNVYGAGAVSTANKFQADIDVLEGR